MKCKCGGDEEDVCYNLQIYAFFCKHCFENDDDDCDEYDYDDEYIDFP